MARRKPTKREIWLVDQLLDNPLFDPEANAEPINIAREVEVLLKGETFEDAIAAARWNQDFFRSTPGFEDLVRDWSEVERIVTERWGKNDHHVGSQGSGTSIPPTTH